LTRIWQRAQRSTSENEAQDFAAAIERLAGPTDIDVALSKLAEIGARLYLQNMDRHPLVMLRAVTVPPLCSLSFHMSHRK